MGGSLGIFLGKFTLTSAQATSALTVGGTAVDLTAGSYYLAGYTSESTAQFVEHVQAQIRAIGATQDASTVVYNGTTNRVTITLETAATLVLAASTATILGYTSTSYGSGTSFVAEQAPRYVWQPSRAPSYYPVNSPPVWAPRLGTIYGRAPDGTSWSLVRPTIYDADIEFKDLPAADVITPTTGTVYRDFQTWFVDVIGNGKPFRWVIDRASYTSANTFEATWLADSEEGVGSLTDATGRRYRSYLGLCTVKIPMAKKI